VERGCRLYHQQSRRVRGLVVLAQCLSRLGQVLQ
jgi:hypothetical protein